MKKKYFLMLFFLYKYKLFFYHHLEQPLKAPFKQPLLGLITI